jgi:hypothetical protein
LSGSEDGVVGRRLGRAALELVVVFVGVTAAFFVEGYRGELDERAQLRQATDGIIAELRQHESRAREHADSIQSRLEAWKSAEGSGRKAVPAFYLIPGATHPPTAAWDAAVSSGVVSLYEPSLRLELGYFYAEFVGISDNYVRRLEFIEREVMPRAREGAEAFYDSADRLRPECAVEMDLLDAFRGDLVRVSEWAGRLRAELEAENSGGAS